MRPGSAAALGAGLQPLGLDDHRLAFQVFGQRVPATSLPSRGVLGGSLVRPGLRLVLEHVVAGGRVALGLFLQVGGDLGQLGFLLRGELLALLPKELALELGQFQQGFLQLRFQPFLELDHFPVRGLQTGGVRLEPGVRRPESRRVGFEPKLRGRQRPVTGL